MGRISIDNDVHFGQPCITGTRIPVYCILELIEAGISFETIVEKYYPNITIEDIKACVQYAMNVIKAEEVHITD